MMKRILMISAALLCSAAGLSPYDAHAQAAADSALLSSLGAAVEAQEAAGEATVAAPTSSGLPQRAAPPRTMSDKWPVFIAFAVTWIGIIGYFLQGNRHSAGLAKRLIAREEER